MSVMVAPEALEAARLGVDSWSGRCRIVDLPKPQYPSGAGRGDAVALASLVPSAAVVKLSRRKNGT